MNSMYRNIEELIKELHAWCLHWNPTLPVGMVLLGVISEKQTAGYPAWGLQRGSVPLQWKAAALFPWRIKSSIFRVDSRPCSPELCLGRRTIRRWTITRSLYGEKSRSWRMLGENVSTREGEWGRRELEKKEEERVQVSSWKGEFIVFFTLLKMDIPFFILPQGQAQASRHTLLKVPYKSIKNWLPELPNTGKRSSTMYWIQSLCFPFWFRCD